MKNNFNKMKKKKSWVFNDVRMIIHYFSVVELRIIFFSLFIDDIVINDSSISSINTFYLMSKVFHMKTLGDL